VSSENQRVDRGVPRSSARHTAWRLFGGSLIFATVTFGLVIAGLCFVLAAVSANTPLLRGSDKLLLHDQDVPDVYQRDNFLSGELNRERLATLGVPAQGSNTDVTGAAHIWINPRTGEQVRDVVFDAGSERGAARALEVIAESFRSVGYKPLETPGVEGSVAGTATMGTGEDARHATAVSFARGSLLFLVATVEAPRLSTAAKAELALNLAAKQESRVESEYTSRLPQKERDVGGHWGP